MGAINTHILHNVIKFKQAVASSLNTDCKLIEPFVYDYENGTLYPWLLDLTTQNTFMISSDKILTLAEPSSKIVKKYESVLEE